MILAVWQHVTVQSDGIIQICVPEFKPGTIAEVIVWESSEQTKNNLIGSFIGKGKGAFTTPEDADAFIKKERQSWE